MFEESLLNSKSLTLPAGRHAVVPLPARVPGASDRAVELVSFAKSARLAAGRGEPAQLAVLHHWPADPVDLGVTAHGLVEGVDHDHLEELVGGVLSHPVGVQHTQTLAFTAGTLLCGGETRDWVTFCGICHISIILIEWLGSKVDKCCELLEYNDVQFSKL